MDGERSATEPGTCSGFFILDARCDPSSAAGILGLSAAPAANGTANVVAKRKVKKARKWLKGMSMKLVY